MLQGQYQELDLWAKSEQENPALIRVVTPEVSNPCPETIIDLGHMQPIKPSLCCLESG